MFRVVPADEIVIRNVEVAGTGVVCENTKVHIFETASFHGQPFRTGDELRARPNRDIGISDRDAFEIVIVRGFNVEQVEIAVTVEDDLSVSGALDDYRLVRSAARGQIISSFKRRGSIYGAVARVVFGVVLVCPAVDQNYVTRVHTRPARGHGIAAAAIIIIRAHETVNGRL